MTLPAANLSAGSEAGVSLASPAFVTSLPLKISYEEKPLKNESISLRRRYLMLTAVAGAAAPAGLFAAPPMARTRAEPLIVSGRVVDGTGAPLAGARIDIADVTATTDGDGRFMVKTAAGIREGCPDSLECRIMHSARQVEKKLEFSRARVVRDEAGAWRAGVSLNTAWRA
jgi:hypothetical protein